jgi:hypothetical protein
LRRRPSGLLPTGNDDYPAAIAVRPGEHACFRFQRRDERERIADAFMRVGLRLGHRVVYLCESRDVDGTLLRLDGAEPDVASALRTGALEVRDANTMTSTAEPSMSSR